MLLVLLSGVLLGDLGEHRLDLGPVLAGGRGDALGVGPAGHGGFVDPGEPGHELGLGLAPVLGQRVPLLLLERHAAVLSSQGAFLSTPSGVRTVPTLNSFNRGQGRVRQAPNRTMTRISTSRTSVTHWKVSWLMCRPAWVRGVAPRTDAGWSPPTGRCRGPPRRRHRPRRPRSAA